MKRKRMESSNKIPISIKKADHEYILEKTLVEAEAFGLGRVKGDEIPFKLSPEEIEYIQDYIAAGETIPEAKESKRNLIDYLIYLSLISVAMQMIKRFNV